MCLCVVHVLSCDSVWLMFRVFLCMLVCIYVFVCFARGLLCDAVWFDVSLYALCVLACARFLMSL